MTAPDAPRRRNPRGQGDLLRDEIIEAAETLIDESAVDDVTLRGIARQAGISAPSIYSHFADLQSIRDAVLERSFTALDAAIAAAMDGHDDPEDRLTRGCLGYVRFGWEHRSRYAFMFRGDGFAPNAVRSFERIADTLAECVERGSIRDGDLRDDTFLLWVGLYGMATLEKPARPELRRLGTLDRLDLTKEMVRRLAGLR